MSFSRPLKVCETHEADKETGTLWLALASEAMEGKLAANVLRQIPSMMAFWFAWADYFPETKVFQDGG
ncbi:MAG TPA: DUF3179 domain-containing (seleno)protein [Candidatus Tripitaka californicus]|uniref:DUF3179 domain-containing (seleno)protein n=1 Tax=Candidatus Tripitaka californicus TaxID=3367616 RepID=UPI00402820A3